MDGHATVELAMTLDPPTDLPDDLGEALADADVEAGRVVSHTIVREWLKTVGTADQKPTPFSWRK